MSAIKQYEKYLEGLVEGVVDCGDGQFTTGYITTNEELGEYAVNLDPIPKNELVDELYKITNRINGMLEAKNIPLHAYISIELVFEEKDER